MTGQAKRLLVAVACIAAVLCAFVAADRLAVLSPNQPVGADADTGGSVSRAERTDGNSQQDVAQRLFCDAGGARVSWGDVPDSFAERVFDPEALGAIEVASVSNCVGAVFDDDAAAASARVESALEGNGWRHAREADGDANGLYGRNGSGLSLINVSSSEAAGCLCMTVSLWKGEW